MLFGRARLFYCLDRVRGLAGRNELAFFHYVVKRNPDFFERLEIFGKNVFKSKRGEFRKICFSQVFSKFLGCEPHHAREVLARVPILGEFRFIPPLFLVPVPKRPAKFLYLVSHIIMDIFAENFIPGFLKHARERLANRSPAHVPEVNRAGRVCGHVFHARLFALTELMCAVASSLSQNLDNLILENFRLQPTIDKPGRRNLNLLD